MPTSTLSNEILKDIAGNGSIEYCLYNQRSKSGMPSWEMPSWEIKIKNENGSRKIIVVRDYGFEISTEQIKMNSFKTRTERNKEIYRLYHEEGLSQMFLANLFNMSQPSVSIIVNPKAK